MRNKSLLLLTIVLSMTLITAVACATKQNDDEPQCTSKDKTTPLVTTTTPTPTTTTTTPTPTTTTTTPITTTTPVTTTQPAVTTTTPVTTQPAVLKNFEYYSKLENDGIIALYKENGCSDDLLPSQIKRKLSDEELDKIKTFFLDQNTLRFIPNAKKEWNYFTSNGVDLNMVIIASFAPKLSEVSEEEKLLLPQDLRNEDFRKLTTAQIKELYKKYLGVDFDSEIHAIGKLYLEAYDSYYYCSSGVEGPFLYFQNFCAWSTENEDLIILLEDENGTEFFATIKPSSDSFIIRQAFCP